MNQTVIGLFNKSSDAQDAKLRLLSNGFTNDNVDLSLSYQNSNTGQTDFNLDSDHDEHESGIGRFFKNLFGDNDNDADKYSKAANRGNSVVTVHAQSRDEAQRAADILDDCGAIDVDKDADDNSYNNDTMGAAPVGVFNETTGTTINLNSTADSTLNYSPGSSSNADLTGTSYSGDTTGLAADMTTGNSRNSDDITDDVTNKSIPIIEENLEVGKRTVETGGVRLRSRIVEKPVEEELRLRKERVYVERNPVDRAATDADFDTFKEGKIELTEHAEVPVVNKQARVVEEVSIGKDVDERTETVRDTVRKTEVDVEDLTNKSNKETDTKWRSNS